MKQKNVGAEIMQSFGITEICRKSKISIRPDGRMEIIFDTIKSLLSVSALNFVGTHAACANVYVLHGAVNNSLYTSDVRFPGSVAASVRVRYLYTEINTFTAKITFSHDLTPPLSHDLIYEI